jgi:hypothetical protein
MHKKVIGKTSVTNMSKSEKVHISVTFLLITFLGNSAFFDIHTEFFHKKLLFLLLLPLFVNFD